MLPIDANTVSNVIVSLENSKVPLFNISSSLVQLKRIKELTLDF